MKTGYVLTNSFFMSQSAKERLSPFYAVAALELLAREAADNNDEHVPITPPITFKNVHSKAFKVLELWHGSFIKKYDRTAKESQALARVVDHLTSDAGIKKVIACMHSGTLLHGTGDDI